MPQPINEGQNPIGDLDQERVPRDPGNLPMKALISVEERGERPVSFGIMNRLIETDQFTLVGWVGAFGGKPGEIALRRQSRFEELLHLR